METRGNVRELPRGDRAVRGDHKEAMKKTMDNKEVLSQSGDKEWKENRGRGVLGNRREGERLGTKREDILVLQILTES